MCIRDRTETEPVIIFEGIEAPATLGLKASRSANYQRKKQGFYARFFLTNSAPVSYTHLDVYKRQKLLSVIITSAPQCIAMWQTWTNFSGSSSTKDVYKRQNQR